MKIRETAIYHCAELKKKRSRTLANLEDKRTKLHEELDETHDDRIMKQIEEIDQEINTSAIDNSSAS